MAIYPEFVMREFHKISPAALRNSLLHADGEPLMSAPLQCDFLTERKLAEETGVSIFTVRRWRKERGLRAVKLGREWRVRNDWFVAWLDIQSANSPLTGTPEIPREGAVISAPAPMRSAGVGSHNADMQKAMAILATPARRN